ncbi:MAG: bifunctional phosphoribosylaminoimidazolecarboxamide formyltransferase/IMP cyclohydrolase [Candidatus Melainabacteria bacterium]|nr:MAG: bifunctional phosphoribosylaminoimidazolecarboxamide formyltransferase/IMP cyclohydrolase [Candidatus Melainabacteria bacterium]
MLSKLFYNTAKYDSIINTKLANVFDDNEYLNLNIKKLKELRYGENPHQKATLYELPIFENQIADYQILNGKELSYNNYLDMTYALNIASEFYDVHCCTIVKHNIPCGVALGASSLEAYQKALDCDPISAFGGIVAFTKDVDINVAKHLKELFLEVIIAPNFDDDALELLQTKKNLRLIKLNTKFEIYKRIISKEIKITPFGTLVQSYDVKELDKDTFKVVTKTKPDKDVIEDLIFAWKIAKHVKSNAIVIAKDFKTLGISGGNTSRVESCEISLNKACDGAKDAVLASDGFFPAIDNIQYAAQGRIKAIIQPGGSIKDKDVIETADKYNIAMVTTGIRHFKH